MDTIYKFIRIRTAIILFLFIWAPVLYSLTGTEGVGNPILDLGLGARPLGCGGAFVAVANDGNAGYWNPAGLSQLNDIYLTSMYTTLFLGTKFYYLSLSVPFDLQISKRSNDKAKEPGISLKKSSKLGSISVLWVESFVSGLKNTKDAFDPATGLPYTQYDNFTARDDAILLAYGIRPVRWLAVGLNAKYTLRNLGINDAKGHSLGFDAGFMVTPIKRLNIAGLVQDVGNTPMYWHFIDEFDHPKNSKELIISRLKAGMSYDFIDLFNLVVGADQSKTSQTNMAAGPEQSTNKKVLSGKDLLNSLLLCLEVRWQMEKEARPTYHFGMEWAIYDMVFIRIGFDDVNFTAGIGFKSKVVALDYAYVTHPDLDNTHRISLTARF